MMRSLPHISSILGLSLVLGVGCYTDAPLGDARLTLALPQTAGGPHYGEAFVQQGDSRQQVQLDAEGNGTVSITSGIETTVSALLFEIAPQSWSSFDGHQTFVPVPGANEITVDIAQVAIRELEFHPVFDNGAALTMALPLVVRDLATGFEDATLFTTTGRVALPEGRAFTVTVTWPGQTQTSEVQIAADVQSGETIDLPIGPEPSIVPPAEPIQVSSSTVDLSAFNDPTYTIECAIGTSCTDPTNWLACGADFTLSGAIPGDVEGSVTIQVRFHDAPELGCTEVEVIRDQTPPMASIVTDPPLLADTAPASIRVTVDLSEPVDDTTLSLAVKSLSDTGFSASCASLTPTELSTRYTCTFSASTWTPDDGSLTLVLTGADRAGNSFTATGHITYVANAAGNAMVVGVRTLPPVLELGMGPFLLGVDIANFGPSDLCNLYSMGYLYMDEPAGGASLQPFDYAPQTLTRLPHSTPTAPAVRTLWFRGDLNNLGGSVGSYSLRSLDSLTSDDCLGSLGPTLSFGGPYPIEVTTQKLRALSPNRVTFGLPTVPSVGAMSPQLFNIDPYAEMPVAYESTHTDVIKIVNSGRQMLELNGPGIAHVTASLPDNPDAGSAGVEIELVNGPAVAVLDNEKLHVVTGDVPTEYALDPAFAEYEGFLSPLKVLWESTRNAFVVVYPTGIQIIGGTQPGSFLAPCGSGRLLDGTLTAASPAHDRATPDLALLVSDGTSFDHCTVRLDNPTQRTLTSLADVTSICPELLRLVADPVSGQFTVVGRVLMDGYVACAATYTHANGALGNLTTLGDSMLPTESLPRSVSLDPRGAFVPMFEPYTAEAGGVAVGPAVSGSSTFPTSLWTPNNNTYLSEFTAMAVDPVTGDTFAAGSSTPPMSGAKVAHLFKFVNRHLTTSSYVGEDQQAYCNTVGGFSFQALAFDPAQNRLFALDDWVTQGVWAINPSDIQRNYFDGGAGTIYPTTMATGGNSSARDFILVGPQPWALEPRRVREGSIATISGVGFAGSGDDKVYVNGILAETLSSSATTVTFKVPVGLIQPWMNARLTQITVRSHDRMSGAVPGSIYLDPIPPAQVLGTVLNTPGACSSFPCYPPAILDTADGIITLRGDPAGSSSFHLVTIRNPQTGAFVTEGNTDGAAQAVGLAGGNHLVGYRPGSSQGTPASWVTGRTLQANVPTMYGNYLVEPTRVLAEVAAPNALTLLTADPSGRYLAFYGDDALRLYWGHSLLPTPQDAGTGLPTGSITAPVALRFSADGSALATVAPTGALDVYTLGTTIAAPQHLVPSDCPRAFTALLAFATTNTQPPGFMAILSDGAVPATIALATAAVSDTGTWSYACQAHATLDVSPKLATISPHADMVAFVTEDAESVAVVQLLTTADLNVEVDRLENIQGPFDAAAFTPGVSARGPTLYLEGADYFFFATTNVVR